MANETGKYGAGAYGAGPFGGTQSSVSEEREFVTELCARLAAIASDDSLDNEQLDESLLQVIADIEEWKKIHLKD